AHGGCTGLAEMAFGAIVTHHLTNLQAVELTNHSRSDQQGDCQRCQDAENTAHGDVLNHRKATINLCQVVSQPYQHYAGSPLFNFATTFSIPALRDPLTSNTMSPASKGRA